MFLKMQNFGGLGSKTEIGDFGPKTIRNTFLAITQQEIMI